MHKISDFHIAYTIIKSVCHSRHCAFVDIPVLFAVKKDAFVGFDGRFLNVGSPKNIGETNYIVSMQYLKNFQNICGIPAWDTDAQAKNAMSWIFMYIQELINNGKNIDDNTPFAMRLYQNPLVWIFMKDIICPVYDVPLDNIKMVLFSSPYSDTRFVAEDETEEKERFIFVNTGINYRPCEQAGIICSVLDAYGLNYKEVLTEIFESQLLDKLIGLADLSFEDDGERDDFILHLSCYAGIQDVYKHFVSVAKKAEKCNDLKKFAQLGGLGSDHTTGSWWYLGLIEKSLEPVRGPDWSTYYRMAPWIEELNQKIEAARKKKGRAGLNLEALLRLKDGEVRKEDIYVLEKALSSNRVW